MRIIHAGDVATRGVRLPARVQRAVARKLVRDFGLPLSAAREIAALIRSEPLPNFRAPRPPTWPRATHRQLRARTARTSRSSRGPPEPVGPQHVGVRSLRGAA